MKVVILCGGYGTRLQEEKGNLPKHLVEIGGRPILWHIMKLYHFYGYKEFILCLGDRSSLTKEYFYHYVINNSSVSIWGVDKINYSILGSESEDWKVTLIDTGPDTATGGRIKRIQDFIGNETFMVTYGDGVSNINIQKLLTFHHQHSSVGEIVTLTAVPSAGRFGAIELGEYDHVSKFVEKPDKNHLINAGFFVMEPRVFDYIEDDRTDLVGVLKELSEESKLVAYKHGGYWKCMDTAKDKAELEAEWKTGKARWQV